LYRSVLFLS